MPVGPVRSIPSLEVEGASVLDEFYWLNKEDPTYSLRRATWKSRRANPHGRQYDLVAAGAARAGDAGHHP